MVFSFEFKACTFRSLTSPLSLVIEDSLDSDFRFTAPLQLRARNVEAVLAPKRRELVQIGRLPDEGRRVVRRAVDGHKVLSQARRSLRRESDSDVRAVIAKGFELRCKS